MEIIDNQLLELLKHLFSDAVRADVIKFIAFGMLWRELSGIRKGLDAVVARVDNHEVRIIRIEAKKDAVAN